MELSPATIIAREDGALEIRTLNIKMHNQCIQKRSFLIQVKKMWVLMLWIGRISPIFPTGAVVGQISRECRKSQNNECDMCDYKTPIQNYNGMLSRKGFILPKFSVRDKPRIQEKKSHFVKKCQWYNNIWNSRFFAIIIHL